MQVAELRHFPGSAGWQVGRLPGQAVGCMRSGPACMQVTIQALYPC